MLQHPNQNQLTVTGRGAPTVSAAGLILGSGCDDSWLAETIHASLG